MNPANYFLNFLMVGTGGAVGAMLRYGFGIFMLRLFPTNFPWGTLGVNLIGSLLIGLLAGIFAETMGPHHTGWLFLAVGILGGFTTFSTFGLDQVLMLLKAEYLKALLYVGVSVVGGLVLTGLGFWVGKGLH
jgi:CrcB protein